MSTGIDITQVGGSDVRARALFRRVYGAEPAAIASAPGRVNLIGDHIDYCGGLVVPRILRHATSVAIGPLVGGQIAAVSEAFGAESEERISWERAAPGNISGWFAYVVGTLACLADGGPLPRLRGMGVQLAIASDVPVGAGLSSSAALEVATARAAIAMLSRGGGEGEHKAWGISEHNISAVARRAEQVYAGVPCGIMDQVVCTSGRDGYATAIDCQTGNISHVRWPQKIRILVLDSGIKHYLAAGEYAARRAACERALTKLQSVHPGLVYLCQATPERVADIANAGLTPQETAAWKHVTTENALAGEFCRALTEENFAKLGAIYADSHRSLSQTYNVSCAEVDTLVDRARSIPGVLGARMTGGGFGGCVVVLAGAAQADDALRSLLMLDIPRGFCLG